MEDKFDRMRKLIGTDAEEKLKKSSVCVFGAGGVGSYTIEALARCGIGEITVVDGDALAESNINRQLLATVETIGQRKADAAVNRIKSINPDCKAVGVDVFYNAETAESIDFSRFNYIVDAIDTVTSKLLIIKNAEQAGVPVISSMGTGNKLDASMFEITDISKTSVCPLARVMRREIKQLGIKKLKVLYSKELPKTALNTPEGTRPVPASIAFVPSVAGLLIAGEVVRDITGLER